MNSALPPMGKPVIGIARAGLEIRKRAIGEGAAAEESFRQRDYDSPA
jgi:hypothetical protein